MNDHYFTYNLTSKRKGALFVGVPSDLLNCVLDHKCNLSSRITSQYASYRLVYYECHEGAELAHQRGLTIQQLHRIWKLDLIDRQNPFWRAFYDDLASGVERGNIIGEVTTAKEP